MKRVFTSLIDHFRKPVIEVVLAEGEAIRLAIGRAEARAIRSGGVSDAREAEFSVFSQFGEDGVIQFLASRLGLMSGRFVEIGVEDYSESNTRFLMQNDDWIGLIVDAGTKHIDFAHSPRIAWRHRLDAVSAFVTAENINILLTENGYGDDVDLFSIDIDGNDYWILESLTAVRPTIVIAEYNSIFGVSAEVSVPYRDDFDRSRAHWSWLYFGASLGALCFWAEQNRYDLVATTRAGNNAFFIDADVSHGLQTLTAEDGYQRSTFREARDRKGQLSLINPHTEGRAVIHHLPVVDVRSGESLTLEEALRR